MDGRDKAGTYQDSEVSSLVEDLKRCLPACPHDSINRKKLREAAHRLAMALETPGDTAQRYTYLAVQTSVIRIGNQLDLFKTLLMEKTAQSSEELAHKLNVDSLLLLRLLRYLAAIGAIQEAGKDSYVANILTSNLAVPLLASGVNLGNEVIGVIASALPSSLAKTNYKNPTDPKSCAFQEGFGTEEALFEWLPQHPDVVGDFSRWMKGQREGRANWLDWFPFEEQVSNAFRADNVNSAAMLIDIGGGLGQEIEAIKMKYPKLPGRFVLQDLQHSIDRALPVEGMELMAHDFFQAQPIKGARLYYFRSVLHNWTDDKCQTILAQIAPAMNRGYSKIIVNDVVLPDQGASLVATQLDIVMMAINAGFERSESQWRKMVDSAGLQITKIWTDDPEAESIIEIELK